MAFVIFEQPRPQGFSFSPLPPDPGDVAGVAGAWKYWAQEKRGSARKRARDMGTRLIFKEFSACEYNRKLDLKAFQQNNSLSKKRKCLSTMSFFRLGDRTLFVRGNHHSFPLSSY